MLVYFLASSGERLRKLDANFDARFYISYDARLKALNITRNENYLNDYWGDNISSVSAIVGENGVGKTSILRLVKDRFRVGLNHHLENTILIYENDGQYVMYYDEELFDEKIVINGEKYEAEHYLVKNTKKPIRIKELGIEIILKKVFKEDKEGRSANGGKTVEASTRIGKDSSLIFQTNNWSYSRQDRMINQYIYSKELDYFDNSIGERIDSIIRERTKYIPPIADLSDISAISEDARFENDYLFELQAEEMIRTLAYLKIDTNRELLEKYLKIPEELYICYDFMDSKNRNHVFTTEDAYLRFENRKKNSGIENAIYTYLLQDKRQEMMGEKQGIKVKEALMLSFIERYFVDLDLMISGEASSKISSLKMSGEIISDDEIIGLLNEFKNKVIDVIQAQELNEVNTSKEQEKLVVRFQKMTESYIGFLKYILNEFADNTSVRKSNVVMFKRTENGGVFTKQVTIEHPVISTDKQGAKLAHTFLKKYSALESRNKSLYFAWRNMSSGENQLLTLLTSLFAAIERAKHKNILILLDEIEVSMHPAWQKEIIKILVDSLNVKAREEQKRIQIIMATHSPFILSDLPLNSTILLERDDFGNTIRKDGLDGQPTTLGANIHELYSHSFFLNGGLIGEYAKRRINEVANTLISASSDQTINWSHLEKFINQVGEPIIKARLVELYNQKYQLTKPNERLEVKSEIESLKKRLEYLEMKQRD